MSRYDWMESAACAQVDPDIFHIEGQGVTYKQAIPVCQHCPVQRECASFAQVIEGVTSKRHRHGLWAGQVPREREESSEHLSRTATHDIIVRLHGRGGMSAKEIAAAAGCDERTVYRVLKQDRADSYRAAA